MVVFYHILEVKSIKILGVSVGFFGKLIT